MARDRETPCISYVCAGESCKKGRKNVTMKTCQTCEKYRPRKTGNAKKETAQTKKNKAKTADARKQMSDYR